MGNCRDKISKNDTIQLARTYEKIYITGIAGLLGSNIASELKNKYQVSGVDCLDINLQDIKYDVFDVRDHTQLRKSIEQAKPDVLIHTIAVVNVDLCEIEKELANKVNAQLTKEIAQICNDLNIKMVYISTDAVFDGNDNCLYQEDDAVAPINEYGKTKYLGEQFVREYQGNLILRTNIYGINIQNKNSFGEWIVKSLVNDEELNMFTDIYFSPILVNELARVIDKCMESDLSGIYHACGTGAISKYDFGMKVKEIFDIKTGKIKNATSDVMNFKAPRAKHMGMSNKKLCEVLNISICTPEESIEVFKCLMMKRIE